MSIVAYNKSSVNMTQGFPPSSYIIVWIDALAYIMTPLLFVIGITGNLLILTIMRSKQSQRMTVSHVLTVMSICDLVVDFQFPFTKASFTKLTGFDLKGLSESGCNFFFWAYRTGKFFSAWLMALVAVERFVAVCYPLRMKQVCSKRNAYLAMGVIFVVLTTYDAIFSVMCDRVVRGICINNYLVKNQHDDNFWLAAMASIIYVIAPSLIMIQLNSCVIHRLIIVDRRRRRQVAVLGDDSAARIQTQNNGRSQKTTFVLLVLTAAFIVLVSPMSMAYMVCFFNGCSILLSTDPQMIVFREVAQILEQMNYSVNVFFYLAFNSSFRAAVLRKFQRKTKISNRSIQVFTVRGSAETNQ